MKNYRHDDSGTRKTEQKASKHENFNKQNKSGEKRDKPKEENRKQVLHRKVNLREGTCY